MYPFFFKDTQLGQIIVYFCRMGLETQKNNPLHGVTLKAMVEELHAHYGWQELALLIRINCFASNPSVSSSLKFLRKNEWARQKVEKLYLDTFH